MKMTSGLSFKATSISAMKISQLTPKITEGLEEDFWCSTLSSKVFSSASPFSSLLRPKNIEGFLDNTLVF
jgi:hypothetical protein